MRTSPLAMRLHRARRVPALAIALALLLAAAAACGGDDGDDDTSPTTTEVTTTEAAETTTTEPPETTEATEPEDTTPPDPDAPVEGDDANVLTEAQVAAQVTALVGRFRAIVLDAVSGGGIDETVAARLTEVFTPQAAADQFDGLVTFEINPSLPPLTVSDVAVTDSVDGCANGSATLLGLVAFATPQLPSDEAFFKLVPAEAGSAWRLDFLAPSTGAAPVNIECEA